MFKNKKVLIIVAIVIVLGLLGAVLALRWYKAGSPKQANTNLPAPDFLNETEKQELDLAPASKIQVLLRGANGEVMVYKVIRNDADIVVDPSKIGAPSQSLPAIKATSTVAPLAQ